MPYQPDPAVPAEYGRDEKVPVNRLIPGVTLHRATEPAGDGLVWVPVPCCGRRATVATDKTDDHTLIGCTTHELAYAVTLHEENDGWDEVGHDAVLTVEDRRFKVARHRPTTTRKTM